MILQNLTETNRIKKGGSIAKRQFQLGALLLFLMNSTILSAGDQNLVKEDFSDEKQQHQYGVITSLTGYFNHNRIKSSSEKNTNLKNNLGDGSSNWSNNRPNVDIFKNVWVDGVQQKKNIYINNRILKSGTHGLRTYGAETDVENINQIIVSNSLNIKPGMNSTKDSVNFKDGQITSGVYKDYIFGALIEKNSHFINNGTIETDGKTGGIFLDSGSKLENNGSLIGNADVGIYSSGADTLATNKLEGKIKFTGNNGMFSNHGATSINEGEISNVGNTGMLAGEGSTIINKGLISNNALDGMNGRKGSTIINEGTIANSMANGIYGRGEGTKILNKGTIINDGANGIFAAGNNLKVINEGVVANKNIFGIYIGNGAKGVNKGEVSNLGDFGIFAFGTNTLITNSGIVANSEHHGMSSSSGGVVINNGTIANKKDHGMSAEGTGSYAINEKDILNEGSFGMSSSNGAVQINKGNISNKVDYGMSASSGSIAINEGIVNNGNYYGLSAEGEGSRAINNNVISNKGNIGMTSSNKGIAINKGEISNGGSYGLSSSGFGSTAINDGIISNKKMFGISAQNGAKIINNGRVSNNSLYGMVAINGGVVNNRGEVSNKSDWALCASGKDSIAINDGVINNPTNDSMIALAGGIILNNTGRASKYMRTDGVNSLGINLGTISFSGPVGMKASHGGEAINKGTISNTGIYGMVADSDGKISNLGDIKNIGDNGMYAVGVNSIAINEGTVANEGIFGVIASSGANAINRGTIANNGVYGLVATKGNSKAINVGEIKNNGDYGLRATDGGIVINEGVINNIGTYKMYAEDPGSVAVNRGIINVDSDGQIAMFARLQGAIINDTTGKIYLNSTNGIGMVANGAGSYIKNDGEIYLGGTSGTIITGANYTAEDSNGNKAMLLDNGATLTNTNTIEITMNRDLSSTIPNSGIKVTNDSEIINAGNFIVKGDLDSKTIVDSTSKFIVESGTIEADSIVGDYYMSSTPTKGTYEDTIQVNDLFKTDNMNANIYSNSAMYDAKLNSSNSLNSFGVELSRKNFNSLIKNHSYASYLENNYTATGTKEKTRLYDIYKGIDTNEKLNLAVNNTFGDSIYPTLIKQTFDMVKSNNKRIKDEVLNFPSIDETRYIGFANYLDSDIKLDGDQSDYSSRISSVSLGIDRLVVPNFRLGGVITVGKTNYDFEDNNARRDEDVYQFNMFGMYQKDNLLSTASAYLGKSSGDLKRDSSLPTINEEMSGDLKNTYYGIDLSIEKRYDIKKVKVIPKASLNIMNVEQEGIKENGTYGLSTDSINSTSVEGGVGLGLERTFAFKNDFKITPAIDAMYYREFADPYDETGAKIKSVSNDKVKITSYDADKDRGVLEVSTNVEKNDFNLKIGAQYEINETNSDVMPFARLIYRY